jgi:hypothetical protein
VVEWAASVAKAAARAMVAANMAELVASMAAAAVASAAASAAEGRAAAARVREDADLAVVAERAEARAVDAVDLGVEVATVQIAVGMTGAMEKEVL